MKKILAFLFVLISFGAAAQTYDTLPTGSKPYGNQLYLSPTGLIIGGNGAAKFRVLGTKKYVDSLILLNYTKAQIDSLVANKANLIGNNSYTGNQTISGRVSINSPAAIGTAASLSPLTVQGSKGGNNPATSGTAAAGSANPINIIGGDGGDAIGNTPGIASGGNGADVKFKAGDGGLAIGGTPIGGKAGVAIVQGGSAYNNGVPGPALVKAGNAEYVGGVGASAYITAGWGNQSPIDNQLYNGSIFLGASDLGVVRGNTVVGSITDDRSNRFQVTGSSKFNGNATFDNGSGITTINGGNVFVGSELSVPLTLASDSSDRAASTKWTKQLVNIKIADKASLTKDNTFTGAQIGKNTYFSFKNNALDNYPLTYIDQNNVRVNSAVNNYVGLNSSTIFFQKGSGLSTVLNTIQPTGQRTISLPDATGTVALTNQIPDISGKLDKSGGTMTGMLYTQGLSTSGTTTIQGGFDGTTAVNFTVPTYVASTNNNSVASTAHVKSVVATGQTIGANTTGKALGTTLQDVTSVGNTTTTGANFGGTLTVGDGGTTGMNVIQITPSSSTLPKIQSFLAGVGVANLAINPDGGNVGIGTTSPTEKLEVNGNIKASSLVNTNTQGVLTSDGNGKIYNNPAPIISALGLRSATYIATLSSNTLTANRSISFPDDVGTLSLGTKIIRTASGDGSSTTILVPHGLPGITSANYVSVTANNAASAGIQYATLNGTDVQIVYTVAPASGTNNLRYSIEIK